MQYTLKRGPKGQIEIKVDVPKAGFTDAYDKVVGRLGAEAKIDGFRPGQVPVAVVEQRVGLTKILNETASFLVSKHLTDVFDKENITPIANPKISIDSLTKGEPFSFVANLYDKPKVTIGNWKTVKVVKIKAKEVTDQDVNASITNIYDAYIKQKAEKKEKGGEGEEEKGKFIYDAQGNKIFLKDDQGEKKKEAKIDDEFAKEIGARDLAHLRELVKHDLETLVADKVESSYEEEIFDKISELGKVEIPDVLIDDELNRILVRLNSELSKQGKELDDYLKEEKLTIDELKEKWRPQSEKNVKITLIMDEIGRQEKVSISREEVDAAMKGVNETTLGEEQKADLERYLAVSIFQAKTLDLVKKTISAK